jgi:hypothetical protein
MARRAPQGGEKSGVATYLWGQDFKILVDCLVLGNSLDENGVKVTKTICVNSDTRKMNAHLLLEKFWSIVKVEHATLPDHLEDTEIKRLKGVYSKIQAWKLFAGHGDDQFDRMVLLEADMLVRANIEKVGQDHPEVIKLVQSGKTGSHLRLAMRQLSVYQDSFEALWDFATQLSRECGLPTVNVTMEHSEHGDHPARVHFHVFLGTDLKGGFGLTTQPQPYTVARESSRTHDDWLGVSAEVSRTRLGSTIFQAVPTRSYYVAGPKFGSFFKRGTSEPIENVTS